MKPNKQQNGYTLIEVMVTVAIVAILASIAYPSYQQYVIRSYRSQAQQFMLSIANREEEYLLNNRAYTKEIFSNSGLGLPKPSELKYEITVELTASCGGNTLSSPTRYCITATPQNSQTNDGVLYLDSLGVQSPQSKWK